MLPEAPRKLKSMPQNEAGALLDEWALTIQKHSENQGLKTLSSPGHLLAGGCAAA
jgi:hypothetical protein